MPNTHKTIKFCPNCKESLHRGSIRLNIFQCFKCQKDFVIEEF